MPPAFSTKPVKVEPTETAAAYRRQVQNPDLWAAERKNLQLGRESGVAG